MRLYCVAPYRAILNHRQVIGIPGHYQDFEDEAEAEWLLRDAPDCWHKSESQTFKRLAKGDTQNRMIDTSDVQDRGEGEAMNSGNFGATRG